MHDIPSGSELTIDYAMIDGDPASEWNARAAHRVP
jgi:hypothetical protein